MKNDFVQESSKQRFFFRKINGSEYELKLQMISQKVFCRRL